MTPALRIVHAGPACSIQDRGRSGWLRYGVTPAGPMDWIAHGEAVALAGAGNQAAAVEIGPGGLVAIAEGGACRLGLSASGFSVERDGAALPPRGTFTLLPGEQLSIRPGPSHVWAYLAASGGFALKPVMGSLATHIRSGIGPLGGVALAADVLLPLNPLARDRDRPELELPTEPAPIAGTVRYIPGPQEDYFSADSSAAFGNATYRVAPRSDRMGYRLAGPPLRHSKGHDIVSDGIAMGAIQVPGDGLPIVLMADRQPTGGYPKIGTVIRADLPRLAQSRAGAALRFETVSIDLAVRALTQAHDILADLLSECRPWRP